jgi:hypothetical protein
MSTWLDATQSNGSETVAGRINVCLVMQYIGVFRWQMQLHSKYMLMCLDGQVC